MAFYDLKLNLGFDLIGVTLNWDRGLDDIMPDFYLRQSPFISSELALF